MKSWLKQEIPDYEGIYSYTGENYLYIDKSFVKSANRKFSGYEDVVVLCELKVPELDLNIFGCEAFGHGSVGVVVAVNTNSEEIEWSMLSSESNPFSSIIKNGNSFIAKSTSGFKYTFELPLKNPKIEVL